LYEKLVINPWRGQFLGKGCMYQETRRRESGRCTTWPVDDNSNTIPWYTALLFVLTPSGASQTRTSAAVVRFALRRCSAGISGATHTHTHTHTHTRRRSVHFRRRCCPVD